MSLYKQNTEQVTRREDDEDDKELRALGYVPSFRREFSNLATISFAFSIMGVCSSVASTFNTPWLLGGPASVTWCWFLGATNCLALASGISEVVSAYPTCGGLYGASARLCPKKYRARVCLFFLPRNCRMLTDVICRWAGLWAGSISLAKLSAYRLPNSALLT